MTKLNDTQSILLSTAAQRDDRSLYPLPAVAAGALKKAIIGLLAKALITERETSEPIAVHREDGDLRYGLFATDAGLAAIGLDDGSAAHGTPSPAPATASPAPTRVTKSDAVVTLLQRADGATLAELIAATGWLPHTTRAALTGLRKKGHAIERSKRDDATCYRIVRAAA